jgi:16S rRNA (adenine1518-N6/adenine1519-N6)-dimethyltransferase
MQAKKSYGQHFLKHDAIAERIANSLQQAAVTGRVLEVGPGMGMLTKFLLAHQEYETFAVEADRDMVEYLTKQYPDFAEKRLISKDFLEFDAPGYFEGKPFCLIGNFPYNISTQILFKLLDWRAMIPEMVGMFQKEVADRVVSKPGSKVYGITSVLAQAFYQTEYLFTVERGSFNPPPKVLSAVIRLSRKENFELGCSEKMFKTIVKTAFNQRRKMLRNTLKSFFPNDILMSDPFFEKRPETLPWEDFVALTVRSEPFTSDQAIKN